MNTHYECQAEFLMVFIIKKNEKFDLDLKQTYPFK